MRQGLWTKFTCSTSVEKINPARSIASMVPPSMMSQHTQDYFYFYNLINLYRLGGQMDRDLDQ